jgi:hypothetical protein
MTITEFLEARLSEDEVWARAASAMMSGPTWEDDGTSVSSGEDTFWVDGLYVRSPEDVSAHIARHDPARVLAECAAKRAVLKQHEDWPVLVERTPTGGIEADDIQSMTFRMVKEIAWLTEREYVKRFGTEPPTTPMVKALAAVYASHEDYRQEWAL